MQGRLEPGATQVAQSEGRSSSKTAGGRAPWELLP